MDNRSPNNGASRDAADDERLREVTDRYGVAVTPAMTAQMHVMDGTDPIGRQFLPDPRELQSIPDERADPIGDRLHEVVPGLVHRYPDRVLLKLVSVCAVYCRFCFRRETVGPGHGAPMDEAGLAAAVGYIRDHRELWEVVLSGGDPLVLPPRRIAAVSSALADIDHVKVLRWHTRVPAVAPSRITADLVAALKSNGKAVYVALHANHPRELTDDARSACAKLIDAGIPMVSQTVLLKGINDDAQTLEALMRAFVETRIKPYYLHHLDRAPGTAHFRTSIGEGQALMRLLRGRVSGLCQPIYVLDIPDGYGKVPIGPNYVEDCPGNKEGIFSITDPYGARHSYGD